MRSKIHLVAFVVLSSVNLFMSGRGGGSIPLPWGVTDLLDGKGSQHGYNNNVHADKGRDWGTFEGKVRTAGGRMTVEGTYKFTGGDGEYGGLTGGGKFETVMKSETEIECSWEGNYKLAKAQAR